MIEREAVLRPNAERVAAKVMDGEAVIIDLTTGTYYSLTDVGGRAWQLVEAGLPVVRIGAIVAKEYGVSGERATADVEALVAHLLAEQLVTAAEASGDDVAVPDPSAPAGASKVYRTPELQIYRDMQDLLALDPPMPGLQDIPWK